MNCEEILKRIEEDFPLSSAEDWDNPGLLAGRREKEVKTVLVALDATDEVIDQAIESKADLLVTHHPMIFSAIKQVNSDTVIGTRLIRLIENGISYYAMHTNYDVCGMADLNAEMLGLEQTEILTKTGEEEGLGKVGKLKTPMTYSAFAQHVKEVFDLSDVRCYGEGDPLVSTVAICSGNGKSLMSDVLESKAEVFITGDVDYHTGIDAWAKGLRVIDAGHYGTEHCFIEDMVKRLKEIFPSLEIKAANQSKPYRLI